MAARVEASGRDARDERLGSPRIGRVSRDGRRAALTLLSLSIGGTFLFLAFRRIDWRSAMGLIEDARLWPWLPAALACCLAGYVVRGFRCRRLTSRWTNLSPTTATNVVVVGYAVNNILPARLGELARSAMLSEQTGMSLAQTLTVTFLERVVDGIVILVFFLASQRLVSLDSRMHGIEHFAEALFGTAAAVVLLTAAAPTRVRNLSSRLVSAVRPQLHDRALALVTQVISGVAYLRRPRDAAAIMGLTGVIWGVEVAMFMFLLPAFGIPMHLGTALVTMAITNIGILLPSTPGFVGPFHYFCMQALVLTGVGALTAASYAILVHLCFFIPITVWGVSALAWYGVQLGDMLTRARLAKELAPASRGVTIGVGRVAQLAAVAATEALDPLLRAVVSALVPWDMVQLREAERRQTLESVTRFVAGQVRALPSSLGPMFATGMFGFRLVVWITHLRGFVHLRSAEQVRTVEGWAYGRVALTRQLFRILRSTALLAFFDDPNVVRAMRHPNHLGLSQNPRAA